MVLPISDDNTGRLRTPYVTYLLIALNVLVFVFLQGLGTNEKFTYAFSTVPQSGGGVAFMAHIGGFIAGAVLVRIFAIGSAPAARA